MTVDAREPGVEDRSSIFGPEFRATSIGLVILESAIAFEAMAVSTALPTAARAGHGLSAFGWAFTGFLVANVVGMVASGQLSDRRGPRLPLIAGLLCFLLGLALAGTATTMVQLVAGRVVQGVGSGLIITAIYVVIGDAYPERLRPALIAATSSAWVVPSLIGPAISGLLTEHASWRWVFLGLFPFGVIGGRLLVPVLRSLSAPESPPLRRRRVPWAVAVALGIAALEQAGQHPSLRAAVLAAVGMAVLVVGLRSLLPRGTFRVRPGVSAPIALSGLFAGTFFGVESLIPLSLSVQHGFSATAAGLPLAVSGFSWSAGSWWQGRLDEDAHPQRRIRLIRTGFVLSAAAAVGVAVASLPSMPGWLAYPAWGLAGLGAGFTMSSVRVVLLKYTADADRGADSAAVQLSDATASALTTGLAGVLVAAAGRGVIGNTGAFVTLDLTLCGVALVGAAVSGRAGPPRVSATCAPG